MKLEGRKVVRFPGKRDVHPIKKGWVNWWETIGDFISRNTRKQKFKKEIEQEDIDPEIQKVIDENFFDML